jgi:hypothetical protein
VARPYRLGGPSSNRKAEGLLLYSAHGTMANLTLFMAASPAVAQGGGGFGLTLPQNVGPRYPGDEQKDVAGCIWRRQWVIDERGHRVSRWVRACY